MSHYPSNSILIQYLIDRIRDSAKAAIPFSALMESCLYHPEGGYYMSSRPKIGKAGDFYTSSNVGSAMGEMIAVYIQRQAAERGWAPDTFTIVEWGAGNGRLAGHINERLRRDRCNGCRYAIVEASPYHAQLAKERLSGEDLPVSWWTEADYRREAGGAGSSSSRTSCSMHSRSSASAHPADRSSNASLSGRKRSRASFLSGFRQNRK